MQRESMEFDILIIGAGPAGLAAAIRLGQLNQQYQKNLKICLLEKAAEIGAQILSGAVFETRALNELIPDWQQRGAPLSTLVTNDQFLLLTQKKSWRLPTPPQMHNQGNYIISLENLCRWLASEAQALGIEIFTGFAGAQIRYDADGKVTGVITGDVGLDKMGNPTDRYQPGVELIAKQTLLAEGCRGSLTKTIIERFKLHGKSPQTYGIGIKELWEVDNPSHQPGTVIHSVGWPLDAKTYGGAFIYHLEKNRVATGFVMGLDYQNPFLDPFAEFQRFKTHPSINKFFQNGSRICYGARALTEGGLQSLPKLTFPGGMIIGDSAGFLNVPKIKGSHTAMKSGMIAAEVIFKALNTQDTHNELTQYTTAIKESWIYKELYQARNIRPAFRAGLWCGLAYAALDTYLLRGKAPWTFKNHADYTRLKPAKASKKIHYPKPDGKISFDKLSSLYLSNLKYNENQPCHLQLINPKLAIEVNYAIYDSPETRYCPANVYEIVSMQGQPKLQINAANCLNCKTCDIKDPQQNINWVPPEGGNGPNYIDM